ncbi:MAG: acyl-CoA dehydrogenase family protein [Pararhodobacter sp.]|nr:acyl-CoA dehydrogenase family protein [Pararhodobacter sp.]
MDRVNQGIALLKATSGWQTIAQQASLDEATVREIASQAVRLSETALRPLGAKADLVGCQLQGERVCTPPGYGKLWSHMARDGWLGLDLPEAIGGQGLPHGLHALVSPFFEGEAMAFMMAQTSTRAAAHLLHGLGATDAARELAQGSAVATICVSEPDAGSDVGRLRTRAKPVMQGWRISGTKCWISFGGQDMAARTLHLLLARTAPPETGSRGLSLFLVPDRHPGGGGNGVTISRLEEKLGLHGSPTCVLQFDDAEGQLLGKPGNGLPLMFGMIALMRLQCALQGIGLSQRAAGIARAYATERRQGGRPDKPPLPIARHADVRRMLDEADAETAILQALVLEVATSLDLARTGDAGARMRAELLLPLAKTYGGETAFRTADTAIQVLGGAGYTREWPAERLLREARVITLFEGTTGMQAQDFLLRRLFRDHGVTLQALVDTTTQEFDRLATPEAAQARALIKRFADDVACLRHVADQAATEAVAGAMLRAGWAAVSGWMAARLCNLDTRLADLGRTRLALLPAEYDLAMAQMQHAAKRYGGHSD